MAGSLRLLLVSWLVISLVACTSMQPLRDTQPTTVRQEIRVGDDIEVTNKQGQTYDMKVTQVDASFLYGSTGKLNVKMPLRDVVRLNVNRVNGQHAAGYVLAGVAVVLVIAGVAIFVHDLKHAFDN